MTVDVRDNGREAVAQFALLRDGKWRELTARVEALARPLDEDERLRAAIAHARLGDLGRSDPADLKALLASRDRRALFRRFTVVEATRAKRTEEAVAFARILADAAPDSAEDALMLARALQSAGDSAESKRQFDRAADLASHDGTFAARRIMTRLRDGDIEGAASLARAEQDRCVDHPRFAKMCIEALIRAGDTATAEAIVDRVRANVTTADVAVPCHRVLMACKRPRDSLDLCARVVATDPTARLHLSVAEAMLALDTPAEDVLVHLTAARAMAADDPMILKSLGEVLLGLAQYEEAAIVLGRAVELAPAVRNLRMLYVRALRFARRFDEAADEIMKSRPDFTGSVAWLRQASAALSLAGREREAADIYAEGVALRRDRMPARLIDRFEQLRDELDGKRIPSARLDWAWNVATRQLGRPPAADRSIWEKDAEWGYLADMAILDWLECRPADMAELVELFDVNAADIKTGFDILAEGRGLLFASAHLGPMYAGPAVIKACGLPFRVVASTPKVSTAPYADALISTTDGTETAVVRQILATLAEGKVVTLAVDGAMSPSTPRVKWEGASVTYSPILAALSRRLKVRSVFAQPYWTEGRIAFDFQPLPFPDDDEDEAAFRERWRAAYFEQIRRFFTREPENLRLSGGIWRHVAPTHAEAAAEGLL